MTDRPRSRSQHAILISLWDSNGRRESRSSRTAPACRWPLSLFRYAFRLRSTEAARVSNRRSMRQALARTPEESSKRARRNRAVYRRPPQPRIASRLARVQPDLLQPMPDVAERRPEKRPAAHQRAESAQQIADELFGAFL